MPAPGSERLHALDAVRGVALMAGVVFHATMSFLPAPPGVPIWIVMDRERSLTLAVLFHLLHTFRMTTFFLIAGFFAHLTFQRRGAERLRRATGCSASASRCWSAGRSCSRRSSW